MSTKKNPTDAQLAAALWAVENPTNDGYNVKTKKYGKFLDPNGVDWLIGPGLKIGDTVEDREYTKAELDKIAATYSRKSLESIGKSYNEVYGTKDFPTPFDTVSVAPKMLMNDVRFRVGRLPQSGYPKLYQAVADGNWAKAIQESRTKFQRNGVWLPDNDRVRRVAETYFPGMFNVSYKPGSWDPVTVRPKKQFGGHRSLAEIGTKESLSEDEYIASRIQQKIDSAVNVMNTRERPRIYKEKIIKPGESYREPSKEDMIRYKKIATDKKYITEKFYNELNDSIRDYYTYNSDRQGIGLRKINDSLLKDYIIKKEYTNNSNDVIYDGEGSTCIFTYTDSYGKERAIPGNQTWLKIGKSGKPIYEEKGFKLLKKGESLKKGDMIQSINYGVPNHVVMFMENSDDDEYKGYDKNYKNIIASYSNGGYYPSDMRRNSIYPYAPDIDNVFRFVGNAADSAQWKKDYEEKFLKKRYGGHRSLEFV